MIFLNFNIFLKFQAPLMSFLRSQFPGTTTSDMFSTALSPENMLRAAQQVCVLIFIKLKISTR